MEAITTTIKYEVEVKKNALFTAQKGLTLCPFNAELRVASSYCRNCKHFQAINEDLKLVECGCSGGTDAPVAAKTEGHTLDDDDDCDCPACTLRRGLMGDMPSGIKELMDKLGETMPMGVGPAAEAGRFMREMLKDRIEARAKEKETPSDESLNRMADFAAKLPVKAIIETIEDSKGMAGTRHKEFRELVIVNAIKLLTEELTKGGQE